MSDKFSILIVDDDQQIAETLKDILLLIGYDAMVAFSGKEAMEKVKDAGFNLLLADIKMPVMDGVDLCKATKQIQPDIPVVMMTAYAHDSLLKKRLNAEAVDVIQKPLDIDILRKFISTLSKVENHG